MAKKEDQEVGIESIKVKLAGEVRSLTLEQARKLHEALSQLFPTPYGQCTRRHYPDYWYSFANAPIMAATGYVQGTAADAGVVNTCYAANSLSVDLDVPAPA